MVKPELLNFLVSNLFKFRLISTSNKFVRLDRKKTNKFELLKQYDQNNTIIIDSTTVYQ